MNQLERVARAICIVQGLNPDLRTSSVIDLDERLWHLCTDEAQAAIDAMEQWQPIDTSPEDTEILVYRPDGIQKREVMLRVDDYWYWPDGESPTSNPTHWMPLPEAPK